MSSDNYNEILEEPQNRRNVLKGVGALLAGGTAAGCLGGNNSDQQTTNNTQTTKNTPAEKTDTATATSSRKTTTATETETQHGTETTTEPGTPENTETSPSTRTDTQTETVTEEPNTTKTTGTTETTTTRTPQNGETTAEITQNNGNYEINVPKELEDNIEYENESVMLNYDTGEQRTQLGPKFFKMYKGKELTGTDGPLTIDSDLNPTDGVMNNFIFPYLNNPGTEEEEVVMEILVDEDFANELETVNIAWNNYEEHNSRKFRPEEVGDGLYKDQVTIPNFRDPSTGNKFKGPETENIIIGDFNPDEIEYNQRKGDLGDQIDMYLPSGNSTYVALGETLREPSTK